MDKHLLNLNGMGFCWITRSDEVTSLRYRAFNEMRPKLNGEMIIPDDDNDNDDDDTQKANPCYLQLDLCDDEDNDHDDNDDNAANDEEYETKS